LATLLIIVTVLMILWFFFFKNKKVPDERVKNKAAEKHGEFHSISIHHNSAACDAVKELDGQRILSAEAPELPLPGCDVAQCQCKFHHHEERRAGERRGAYNNAVEDITSTTMQLQPRKKGDRRKSN